MALAKRSPGAHSDYGVQVPLLVPGAGGSSPWMNPDALAAGRLQIACTRFHSNPPEKEPRGRRNARGKSSAESHLTPAGRECR